MNKNLSGRFFMLCPYELFYLFIGSIVFRVQQLLFIYSPTVPSQSQ